MSRRGRTLIYLVYRLVWQGLDLVLPPSCGGCGRPGARWCSECQGRVTPIPAPICAICGTSPGLLSGDLCPDCRRSPPGYRALRSWSAFEGPVREVLHRLKYRRDIGLGEALTPQLSGFVTGLHWRFNLVVPVPLGKKRLKERGYNQAALIARPLALAMGVAYDHGAVARVRETPSQVGLARRERQENVRDAFMAARTRIRGRSILLVDDVATTGSTLSSCAAALYGAGARDVFALTVARALPRHGFESV